MPLVKISSLFSDNATNAIRLLEQKPTNKLVHKIRSVEGRTVLDIFIYYD